METGRRCVSLFTISMCYIQICDSPNGSNLTHFNAVYPYNLRFFNQLLIKISLELGTRMRMLHEKRLGQANIEPVNRGKGIF